MAVRKLPPKQSALPLPRGPFGYVRVSTDQQAESGLSGVSNTSLGIFGREPSTGPISRNG
jgi:hypothetical protein